MKKTVIFFFFLGSIFYGCAGSHSSSSIQTSNYRLPFLSRRLDLIDSQKSKSQLFLAKGYFYYKDRKRDLHLSVRILRRSDFFRITFRGNLDNALWADILVKNGEVKLHFPLQKRLYISQLKGFDLYSFARIHVSMDELLRLASLTPYLIPNANNVRSLKGDTMYLVFRENQKEQQKLYLDKKNLNIVKSQIFRKKILRGQILYQLYKQRSGLMVPFKCTLTVPVASVRSVLWLRDVRFGDHYTAKEGQIKLSSDVTIRKM